MGGWCLSLRVHVSAGLPGHSFPALSLPTRGARNRGLVVGIRFGLRTSSGWEVENALEFSIQLSHVLRLACMFPCISLPCMVTPRGRDARWTSRSPARSTGVQNAASDAAHAVVEASPMSSCSLSQAAVALATFSFFVPAAHTEGTDPSREARLQSPLRKMPGNCWQERRRSAGAAAPLSQAKAEAPQLQSPSQTPHTRQSRPPRSSRRLRGKRK